MAEVFRKLRAKSSWYSQPWLPPGAVQADAARCLVTDRNGLSVYKLEDPDEQLKRLIAAIAASRNSVVQLDYAIFPESILTQCQIKQVQEPGELADNEVNQWHVDLVDLSFGKLAEFASAIKKEGKIKRYQKKRVLEAIGASRKSNFLIEERLSLDIKGSIQRNESKQGRGGT